MISSVTFIVPALNEQENIEATVADIFEAAAGNTQCQVLIFNDGSADATGVLADRLAAGDRRVHTIHNQKTMGLGYNYFHGVELAQGEYVMMVPGDHEIPAAAIGEVLTQGGKADMVIPYMSDSQARPLSRRIVSRAFVIFLNGIFGLRIAYYNGPCLLRTALVRKIRAHTHGFAYMATVLVRLLKAGHSYAEVGIPLQYRRHGDSKAVTFENIWSVLRAVARLWWDVHFENI